MDDNRKKRDVFYGVVAIATLIIAMIGATLAYFSITASSNTGAVNAKSAIVSISYEDGQQVTLQADELIPADFETVVKRVYEDNVKDELEQASENLTENLCIDANEKQVCSVYRFKVQTDQPIDVKLNLNVEKNTFQFKSENTKENNEEHLALGYALYYVNGEEYFDGDNNKWTLRQGSGTWIPMTISKSGETDSTGDEKKNFGLMNNSCADDADDPDDKFEPCHDTNGEYAIGQSLPISGRNLIAGTYSNRTLNIVGSTNEDDYQIFDLIIFLQNTDENQNIDQGKEFQGTINVSLAGESTRIKGEY